MVLRSVYIPATTSRLLCDKSEVVGACVKEKMLQLTGEVEKG